MPSRMKRSRKQRGHRTHGYGRKGQHRKHPGGRGKAGGEHHHRIFMQMYHPGYFGKCGMRNFHLRANRLMTRTINLDRVWALIPEKERAEFLANPSADAAPVVDVTQWGFHKVLGRGVLPACPLIVKARVFSQEAEAKLKATGGAAVLTA